MGSAAVQGPLWGTRAADWSELTEPGQVPFYEAVFNRLSVGRATRLLDVGCGAGLALSMAADRGATVSGLDASSALLEVAHQRLPGGDLREGDLESLPFEPGSFDAVTSFNAVQYASDPERAVREMSRVVTDDGTIVLLTWGSPEQCEMRDILGALGGLLPPPAPGVGGPFALSRPGALESLAESAGLVAAEAHDVPTPYCYPDVATAVRAQLASGPAARAIAHAGERAVHDALTVVAEKYATADGSVRFDNVFRYVVCRH